MRATSAASFLGMSTGSRHYAPSGSLLVVLAPILVAAGIATALVGRSLRGHGRSALQRFRSPRQLSLALRGQSKTAVLDALGEPRAVADPRHEGRAVQGADRGMLLLSDIWYYPAIVSDQAALAIHFAQGAARHFEFFQAATPAAN